jgi:hypothetical protein
LNIKNLSFEDWWARYMRVERGRFLTVKEKAKDAWEAALAASGADLNTTNTEGSRMLRASGKPRTRIMR